MMLFADHTAEHTQLQVAYLSVLIAVVVPTVGFFYWFLRRMITRMMTKNTDDHAAVRDILKRMEDNQTGFKNSIHEIRGAVLDVREKLNDHIDNHQRERDHA